MAIILDGTTGVATPGVTDTGDLSVAGTTTLTTPLPVTSGGTGASSLSGIAVGNLAGGSAGTIPYQSTVGTTAMLATGTSGQALVSAGPSAAPVWGTPSAATTATNLAGGGAGQIPYQSASGTTAMLAAGTSGQVLTSAGSSAPTWATMTSYLKGSATTATSTLLNNANATFTGTVTGATIGDAVLVTPPSTAPGQLIVKAWVSATDTVTVQIQNSQDAGGSITGMNGTYPLVVFK